MAKMVVIAAGTYRAGVNEIGGVIAIHDDDVELGDSYKTTEVIYVKGLTAAEVKATLEELEPDVKVRI